MPLANLPPADIRRLVIIHVWLHHPLSEKRLDPWHCEDLNVYSAHALYLLGLKELHQELKFPT